MNPTTLWVGHFSTNYVKTFFKSKVLKNILKCQTSLNLNWIKIYDIKYNFFWVPWFQIRKEKNLENLWLKNDHFLTLSGLFFLKYMDIFHKTEVQTVILRCLVCLNFNWIKSNDTITVKMCFFFTPENASFQG